MATELSRTEHEGLRYLDQICWDDSNMGGDGWGSIIQFSDAFGVRYARASQVLKTLATRGYADLRRPLDRRRVEYAVSEKGGNYLLASENPETEGGPMKHARVARGGGKLRSGTRLRISLLVLRAHRGADQIKARVAEREGR